MLVADNVALSGDEEWITEANSDSTPLDFFQFQT